MTEILTPQAALADIPGWEGANVRELSGGLTNRSYRIEIDGKAAVLKIDDRPRHVPLSSRHVEARIQRTAAGRGLANSVLFVSDTIYLTEYLDGIVWSLDCLDDNANLEKLALALKKVHALPLTGHTFDAVGAARHYAKHSPDADPDMIRKCVQTIDTMPRPLNLCCCHNDLVVANIINTPKIRFLDWEYACDNDPFFDIATVAAHHRLSPEQRDFLLDAYFDGDGKRWREQLALQAGFYEALLWLWEAARS